jgi:hypothetical protein
MSSKQIQILPHQQEQNEVIARDKTTGNHILKVHVLSNIENGNGCTVPYNDVSELPDSLLNEIVKLPATKGHNNRELDTFFNKLESEGRTDCEIRTQLMEESKKFGVGTLEDIYRPSKVSYNSVVPVVDLFGVVEITDPYENQYILENRVPSKPYTSIAMFGPVVKKPNGREVYRSLNEIRPFHIAFVDNPAFGKDKAKIRDVCSGDKDSCIKKMTYSSLLEESINTDKNVITYMSESQNNKEIPTAPANKEAINTEVKVPEPIVKSEAPVKETVKEVPAVTVKETVKEPIVNKEESAPKKEVEENNNKSNSREEELVQKLKAIEQEREQDKKYFREKLVSMTIDPKAFKTEEEALAEKQKVMGFIEKYNLAHEDTEWVLAKGYPKITAPAADAKKVTAYNSILYNPSDVTRSVTTESAPNQPLSNEKKNRNKLVTLDY